MASNLVKVTLLADSKGFKKGMSEAETAVSGFEKKSSGFAKAVQGFFALQAVQAVGRFVGDSIKAFADLEQATGSVEAVFGDAADSIINKSRAAADQFGLSMADFDQAAATTGAMLKNQLGLSAEQAAGQTEELIGKASDLAATFGGTTADAISAIGSLLRGERDPIEKYGVSMNDAAIEARALELGLADTKQEIDKTDKAAAALDILFEQTADSTGQFAEEADTLTGKMQRLDAEMENAKASVGQGFGYALVGVLPLIQDAATTVGILGVEFSNLVGAVDGTDTAIAKFETHMGIAADTAQAALTIMKEYGVPYEELIPRLELSTTELLKLKGANDEWLASLGIEDVAAFKDMVGGELLRATEDARTHGLVPLKTAQDELATATEGATSAAREQFDLIDGRLDTFASYTGAVDDQAAAQQAVNDSIAEFGEGSAEHLTALEDLAGANRDVRDAEIEMTDQGGLTRAEFIKQQTELGLTYDQAKLLADKYDQLFTPRTVTHTTILSEERRQAGHTYSGRQAGGPVAARTPYLVGERGPEIFTPGSNGRITPNHALGPSGGTVNNITIHAGMGSDPNAIARAVVQALQRYERANGSIPISIRQP